MDVGKKIRELREKNGWSQRELARRVNLNLSVMNRIESGERPIRDRELAKIADVLVVTADYLLGRSKCLTYSVVLEDVQDLRILEELKKHPALYEELHSNPKVACETLMKFLEFKKTLHKN